MSRTLQVPKLGIYPMYPAVPPWLAMIAGKYWHVRPKNGSDSNSGRQQHTAFATLPAALDAAAANRNDVVLFHNDSASMADTTDFQSETLDWNKNLVHLIGVNAGNPIAMRSRVGFATDYANAGNLFTLSASGCYIAGVHFNTGDIASALPIGCMKVTGERNLIERCHIAGIVADAQDIAGAYSLRLSGAAENLFRGCRIGVDTILAGAAQANSEILVDTVATRNEFEDCLIYRMIGHTTQHPLVKLAAATSIDRFLRFKRCGFLSMSVNYAIAQSGVFKLAANLTQGYIIVEDSWANSGKSGSTVKWDVDDRNKIVLVNCAALAAGDTAGTELLV